MKKLILAIAIWIILFTIAPPAEAIQYRAFRWAAPKSSGIGGLLRKVPFLKKKSDPNASFIDSKIPTSFNVGTPLGVEVISRSHQYIGNALVQGTWVQTIHGSRGETLYSAGALLDDIPTELELAVRRLENTDLDTELKARVQRLQASPFQAHFQAIFAPRVEVAQNPKTGNFEAQAVIEFINDEETEVRQARFNDKGELVALHRVSTNLADGTATVYPNGPKASALESVRLQSMSGDGSLSNSWLRVFSAIDPQAVAPDLNFQFGVNDVRFDEVQAYYYMDRALAWFQSIRKAPLNGAIAAKVYVGNNGKSNAAFYFQKKIYLGSGDGVLYHDMMKDPSVVMHETAHAIIDEVAGLPSQGEGGAMNEGFADFFTACILDNPNIGEASYLQGPYRRTLLNGLHAYKDFSREGIYENGTIVGATFWEIRKVLGTLKAAELALRTLARLGEGGKFADLGPATLAATNGYLSAEETRAVTQILSDRGWKLP